MSIDFASLVLAPNLDVFGGGVVIYPVVTRPGTGPFRARGIFSSVPINVEMQDGTVFSDQQTKLGVRISDFDTLPGRGDKVRVDATGITYWIGDVLVDGQGGATFPLRLVEPAG
jgi:hypothetical protein